MPSGSTGRRGPSPSWRRGCMAAGRLHRGGPGGADRTCPGGLRSVSWWRSSERPFDRSRVRCAGRAGGGAAPAVVGVEVGPGGVGAWPGGGGAGGRPPVVDGGGVGFGGPGQDLGAALVAAAVVSHGASPTWLSRCRLLDQIQ